MNLSAATIAQLAEHLDNCQRNAQDTPKITDAHPDMDWDDAYAIQDAILARHLGRGARLGVDDAEDLAPELVRALVVTLHLKLSGLLGGGGGRL